MKLLVVNILFCYVLLAKATLGESGTDVPTTLVCPDSSGVTLVATLINSCKVHYICEDGTYKVPSKLYKCSESQIMTGKIQDCQENLECPGIDIIKQTETPKIISESIHESESPNRDINKRDSETLEVISESIRGESESFNSDINKRDLEEISPSPIETTLQFFKCLFEVSDVDQFTKKCMDSETFLRQTFIEIDSPKVMEYVSGLVNMSEVEESIDGNSVEDALKAFVKYLAPQCKVLCNRRVGRSLDTEDSNKYRLLTSKETKDYQQNNGTGFVEQVLVPIVADIVQDKDAMANLTRMFRIIIEAAVPLVKEILEVSSEDSKPGPRSFLKIKRKTYDAMWEKIVTEACPIFRQLIGVKFSPIMELWSRNNEVIIDLFQEMENRIHRYMDLLYKGVELFVKYSSTYENSTIEHIQTYSLTEMRKDMESVISILTKDFKESLRKNWNVFLEETGITQEGVTEFFTDIAANYPGIIATIIENILFFLNLSL